VGTIGQAVNLFECCIFTLDAFTIVLPAFLVAGAIVVFLPSDAVMRYFGARANRFVSYGAAAISGNILSVCSCNVVPIFAGILRRGAGIGPAFCFVFAAPAIHIVNTMFTYQVIGLKLAFWRFITVPIIAVLVGLAMAFLFRREERAALARPASNPAVALVSQSPGELHKGAGFLGLLVAVMVFGAWKPLDPHLPGHLAHFARVGGVLLALAALVPLALRWFGREETLEWARQTWLLIRMIVPIFAVAVIVIALIVSAIPLTWIMPTAAAEGTLVFGHPHGNRFLPILISSVFSTLMYFPMLTEVAFTKGLLLKYFALGPALALLLGGPGLSLPGLLLLSRIAGWKKTVAYWLIMVSLITLVALFFGSYFGQYICSCQLR